MQRATAGPGRNPGGSSLQGQGSFSGKLAAALAELYCRKLVDVSELSGDAAAFLPHPSPSQRLIDTNGDAAVEWPGGRLSPAPDKENIQAFTDARLPDG